MSFAAQLRAAREARGLTQRDLALRACLSPQRIAQVESEDNLLESTVAWYLDALGGYDAALLLPIFPRRIRVLRKAKTLKGNP